MAALEAAIQLASVREPWALDGRVEPGHGDCGINPGPHEASVAKKKKDDNRKIVADNRKARFAYAIEDSLEVGIVLRGSEVKSLRNGKANIQEAYAQAKDGEIILLNAHIPEYTQANRFGHEPRRDRKLLVHKKEVRRLASAVQREGMTLVPLRLYFTPRGIAKVELGIARGKKLHDKRQSEKQRDWARDKARILRARG